MAETVTATATKTTTAVSTQVMTALDAGSGVDVVSLARNLTDAEKVPKQALIQTAIDNAEAQVSGYGLISSQLSLLQTAFESLNDSSEVANSYGATTDTALGFTAFDGTEVDGSYAISVEKLALEQIMISDEYNASDYAIGTDSFDISITVGSSSTTTTAITVSSLTPAGVVSAINTADTGVTASLVDTGTGGTNYRIILTGKTGSEGVFTISSNPDLGFGDTGNTLQAAQDAEIEFDGLTITRDSNEFSDVVTGATLTLYETTTSAATVAIYSDTSALQTKLENIVTVYNDFRDLMDELTTSTIDEDIEHSGDLQRDFASARYITNQIRDALREDSSTASGEISAFRDIGVTINSKGDLTFDEATFDEAVEDNYNDVVMMLTANTNDQTLYGSSSVGMAQDVASVIEALLASDGIVATRESNAEDLGEEYEEELATLETRMELLYDRYISQFTAMEVLTEKLNGIKDYLTGQLETLSKAYDK
ncbi:flagellar hook-associated protein FliD [marine gamma proteobacterium HTCC2207]|uniref:Flagellar hook-associated protein 2 n=1 Tax=gamma proteobacterium HTCC2207 TaxID=314287 RepID=Q1YVA5_9GAMM|nr:flagellar hook-associated protein FliD [marine gamma proteobacterium HTCC2207] [gamma proteobacterium HTCC2207]